MRIPPLANPQNGGLTLEQWHATAASMNISRLLHRVLTSELGMIVKRPLIDTYWAVRGTAIANPSIERPIRSLLFICQGNICRSPFAALLASRLLESEGIPGVNCSSAGLRTTQAAAPPREARDAAAAFGITLADHRPLSLSEELVGGYDLLVVMEVRQLVAVRSAYPHAGGRIVLLPLFAETRESGYSRLNIADPFGQPRATFDACYARIDTDLRGLLRSIEFHEGVLTAMFPKICP